jgi:hypothetical protein
MTVAVKTSAIGSWDYHAMHELSNGWGRLMDQFNDFGPPSCRTGFYADGYFSLMDLQGNLADSAKLAMAFSVVLALVVLLLATRSVTITALATLAIAGILTCSMAVLVLMGWELGILE